MSDALKALQARAPKKPEGRKLDAADRREATNSADAKKAREIVRRLRLDNLSVLATAIAKVTSDLGFRHKLEEAVERFFAANAAYMREELKDVNRVVGWMGLGHGRMPPMPDGSPDHKVEFADAWNGMLTLVNEATKVGVHKPHREHPIMLMVDLEEPENTPKLIVPDKSIQWD